jgi:hypothetical protein
VTTSAPGSPGRMPPAIAAATSPPAALTKRGARACRGPAPWLRPCARG